MGSRGELQSDACLNLVPSLGPFPVTLGPFLVTLGSSSSHGPFLVTHGPFLLIP